MMNSIVKWAAVGLICAQANAATYYVDFDGGNDAAAGTSTATAWKSIPGTRNAGDTADIAASYGGTVFSTSSKVPAGTTFKLKGGTTWDNSDGGRLNITSSWYDNATTNAPITLQLDTNWGSGSATVNAAGMVTPIAAVLIQRDAINLDGVIARGITIRGSTNAGIQYKEQNGTSASLIGVGIRYVYCYDNSTVATTDAQGAVQGHVMVRRANVVRISNLEIDGNSRWCNGVMLGESGKGVMDGIVTDSLVVNLVGNAASGDDSGIGLKAFNSQIIFTNIVATNNLKGFDLGEINGSGTNIDYTVVNCLSAWNSWGINVNSAGAARTGTFTAKLFNNLVFSNAYNGANCYAGPFDLYVVHNTFVGNGGVSNFNSANIRINNDNGERQIINAVFLNNLFWKPSGRGNINNHQFFQDTDSDGLSLISDYNGWFKRNNENFGAWAGNEAVPDNVVFAYGANGPGNTGNWFSWYSGSTSAPTNGALGHFHCDAHSRATGGSITNEPPFLADAALDWRLVSTYPGTNLSSFFSTLILKDRLGTNRSEFSMGAFETQVNGTSTSAITGTGNRRTGTIKP